jgi:ATP-dependent protease HslVU (ClpYQ) peptidase subunit
VRKGKKACIAADSLTTWGSHIRERRGYSLGNDKVFKYEDSYIGLVGFAGHQMVLKSYLFGLEEPADFSSGPAIFEFWRKMHRELKDSYFVNPRDDKDDPYESSRILALICNPHGLFYVSDLRSVVTFSRYWAIGSGQEYALGALYANYDRYRDPLDIAKASIAAACEFDNHSDGPCLFYSVKMVAEARAAATPRSSPDGTRRKIRLARRGRAATRSRA